jgi:hypothetical protein
MWVRLNRESFQKAALRKGFGGAGVPPAVLRFGVTTKIAGGTPAPRNSANRCTTGHIKTQMVARN